MGMNLFGGAFYVFSRGVYGVNVNFGYQREVENKLKDRNSGLAYFLKLRKVNVQMDAKD